MTLGLLFWILFIVVTLFRLYHWRLATPPVVLEYEIPYWLLVLVLGVGVFGWPVK